MSFGKWLKNRIENVFMRELYMYKYLERYDINIEKTNRRYEGNPQKYTVIGKRKYCSLLVETKKYYFYRYLDYEDGDGGIILRQDKKRPRRVIKFGEAHKLMCVFKKYLIMAYTELHDNRVYVEARHMKTGRLYRYWFPCDSYEMPATKEGEPFNCWDIPTDIYVEDEQVIVSVCRCRREIRNMGTPIGEDVNYKIIGYWNENPFGFQMVFPLWYIEEEKVDAIEAMKKCDFSDIKPIFA